MTQTKSEQQLQVALGELWIHQPLSQITVQDLVRHAHVGRSTFYRHYLDWSDFLDTVQSNLIQMIVSLFHTVQNGEPDFTRFYQFAQDNRHLLKGFFQTQRWPKFLNQLHKLALQNYMTILKSQPNNNVPLEIRAEFLVDGQMKLVEWWLSQDNPPTPSQMTAYNKIILNFV